MPVVRLTQRLCDSAKSRRRTIFWDTTVKNFGLSVEPTGRRAFVIRYLISGRDRRMTLADASQLSLAQARKLAAKSFMNVAEGRDPLSDRTEARQALTVTDAFENVYFKNPDVSKKKSIKDDRRRFEKEIQPHIGKLKLSSVTRKSLEGLLAKKADAPVSANRLGALLSRAWRVFEQEQLIQPAANPAIRLRRNRESPQQDFLTLEELQSLGAALRAIVADSPKPHYDAYARGLIVQATVGARLSEIFGLRVEDVRPDLLYLRDTKSGEPQTIPITESVYGWLEPLLDGSPQSPVFPTTDTGRMALARIRATLAHACKQAGIRCIRNHTLRHTTGAHAAMAGMSRDQIGQLLRHSKSSKATQVYVHIAAEHNRANAEAMQGLLGGTLGGE